MSDESLSGLTAEEVVERYGRLPFGHRASLGDSLLAPFFGGMMIGFIGFLFFLFAGERIPWFHPNLPFYAYAIVWAATGVWIWARGVWRYMRQLEAIIVGDKIDER